MTYTKKYSIVKYSLLVSSLIVSLLMFFKWFDISYLSNSETHSFLTIPSLINSTVDTFKSYAGNSVTFTLLLLAGGLEYLCIMSSALGIWGIIRTLMSQRRSRLLLASQIIALSLIVIAVIAIIIIDVISGSMLGDIIKIMPTLWLLLTLVALAVSIVTGIMYSKMTSTDDAPDDEN